MNGSSSIWKRAAPAMALASTMTASIIAGLLLGDLLDGALGTKPVFTGALTLAGLVSGAMLLARRAQSTLDLPPPDDSSANSPP